MSAPGGSLEVEDCHHGELGLRERLVISPRASHCLCNTLPATRAPSPSPLAACSKSSPVSARPRSAFVRVGVSVAVCSSEAVSVCSSPAVGRGWTGGVNSTRPTLRELRPALSFSLARSLLPLQRSLGHAWHAAGWIRTGSFSTPRTTTAANGHRRDSHHLVVACHDLARDSLAAWGTVIGWTWCWRVLRYAGETSEPHSSRAPPC